MKIRSLAFALLMLVSLSAAAERIKDLATVLGVRENQLIGYGLVVGLDGSGDQTTQTPFTVQSIVTMLSQMGITLPPGTSLQLKNVAAVTVTASLPPFSRPGQTIDVTVSSIGNAKSLRGGTLLMTPLKGADGQVYAMAQGNMLVSGAGAAAGGSKTVVNHLDVGRIPGGATVERSVPTALGQGDYIYLELNTADFTTATRLADVINHEVLPVQDITAAASGVVPATVPAAAPVDARTIQVKAPEGSARVAFISRIENLEVNAAAGSAKVIINARTGSVVMNQHVSLDDCAVAHGNLTVVINSENTVSQPAPLSQGQTAGVSNASIEIKADKGNLLHLKSGVDLNDVVKALNSIGATPQDMLAILQAMKAAGALRAELEVI
ncbi:flagellar basal body P-ring protein FlgI [Sideroxydans lithotrophicus]|uniref:Flagellar P-ring protein n=1 Tax=Sideroxydans lithotrophicus (strain ES-1) TaxID=580332 RepID=D5CMX6_SIDLE|nr:flagellar basal body P-ring protein FlgI [Sideroxydans lithotrophicus]ADE10812.1 flagellar P-ring protein [Sideroxydans lithotrophicus ES-1]